MVFIIVIAIYCGLNIREDKTRFAITTTSKSQANDTNISLKSSSENTIADNSMMFEVESDRVNSELKCPSTQMNSAIPGFGGKMYSCVSGKAQTVKLFINEKENSDKVENIKLMWNDWFVDVGFGLHADKKEAIEFVKIFSRLYAPKHENQLMDAFLGNSTASIKTELYTIEYSYSRGPKIDERLIVLTPNVIGGKHPGTSPSSTDSSKEISDKPIIATDRAGSVKPQESTVSLAYDSDVIKQVEQRSNENEKKIKKYYANVYQLNQSKLDVAFLAGLKILYLEKGKSKDEKLLGKKAEKLLPQVYRQTREIYASSIEQLLVEGGMDVKAIASGKEKKQLRIVYALMSQPLVYKFQNEIKLDEQAEKLGFTKLVYTNGFESALGQTWTVDL